MSSTGGDGARRPAVPDRRRDPAAGASAQSGPDRGRLDWRPPCRETVRHILRHPMYAGAYVYGFRPIDPRRRKPGQSAERPGQRAGGGGVPGLPEGPVPGVHQLGAVRGEPERGWRPTGRGPSRPARSGTGPPCWPGWCGAGGVGSGCTCGTGGAVGGPTYVCSTLRSDYGLPLCQSVSATEVEAWVAEQVLGALQPAALDASLEAASPRSRSSDVR